MSIIPCKQNENLRKKIEEFSETLKTEAHKLGDHGLTEKDFYNSGLFRGSIERVRGQFSATMREKLENIEILNAFHQCFSGKNEEINSVRFKVEHKGADTMRKTIISRGEEIQRESDATAIRRS